MCGQLGCPNLGLGASLPGGVNEVSSWRVVLEFLEDIIYQHRIQPPVVIFHVGGNDLGNITKCML